MLASVQKINNIEVHPFADKLEIATVMGWKCCVKKGDFKRGDAVVYFEPDSLLPMIPQFEFMRDRGIAVLEDGSEGYRVRTIKLRKVVSTGLIMPLTDFPQLKDSKEGDYVDELIGVKKWAKVVPPTMRGIPAGVFPSQIYKTDEIQVEKLQYILSKYKGTVCYVSEKVDGTSATYSCMNGKYDVCSRNLSLKENDGDVYWKISKMYDIENKLMSYCEKNSKNIAIQGEIIGPSINGNELKLNDHRLLVFNVFDISEQKYFGFHKFLDFIYNDMRLIPVPILEDYYQLNDDMNSLVAMSVGKSVITPTVDREGIVIRPQVEINDYLMPSNNSSTRVSFKVINPEYAVKEK